MVDNVAFCVLEAGPAVKLNSGVPLTKLVEEPWKAVRVIISEKLELKTRSSEQTKLTAYHRQVVSMRDALTMRTTH